MMRPMFMKYENNKKLTRLDIFITQLSIGQLTCFIYFVGKTKSGLIQTDNVQYRFTLIS